MPPGSAAAVASGEYHVRNSRSMNHMIDQKHVCTTSGSATASTSRPPHGRDHQLLATDCCGSPVSWDKLSEIGFSPASASIRLFPSLKAIFDATMTDVSSRGFAAKS